MPGLTIERPQMTVEMWEALKSHIMKQRQKRKQEQEQESAQERHRKEEELKRKQTAMTLEDIKDQLIKLEKRLKELKEEKHELFSQLKKVLNEDDINSKKQRELELISQNTFLTNLPPYHPYYLPPGLVPNNLQGNPGGNLLQTRPDLQSLPPPPPPQSHSNNQSGLPPSSTPSHLPPQQSNHHNHPPPHQQLRQPPPSPMSFQRYPHLTPSHGQHQQQHTHHQVNQQLPTPQQVNQHVNQNNQQNIKRMPIKRPHEKTPSPPPLPYNLSFPNYKGSVSYTPSVPKTTSSSSSPYLFYPGGPSPSPSSLGYELKGGPPPPHHPRFHMLPPPPHSPYPNDVGRPSPHPHQPQQGPGHPSHDQLEFDSQKYFPIRGLVPPPPPSSSSSQGGPGGSFIPIQLGQPKPGGITSGFPVQRNQQRVDLRQLRHGFPNYPNFPRDHV